MELSRQPEIAIPPGLTEAIRSFPPSREITHCGQRWLVSPFDLYAECPHCGKQLKIRAMGGGEDIEDVFDAFFEWLSQPGADAVARKRQRQIEEDRDE